MGFFSDLGDIVGEYNNFRNEVTDIGKDMIGVGMNVKDDVTENVNAVKDTVLDTADSLKNTTSDLGDTVRETVEFSPDESENLPAGEN